VILIPAFRRALRGGFLLALAAWPGVAAPQTGTSTASAVPGAKGEPARGASASLLEELAGEAARARDFQAELDRIEAGLERAANEEETRSNAALDRVAVLAAELRNIPAGGDAGDGLYRKIVEELMEARPDLRRALDALREPATVRRYTPSLDMNPLRIPSLAPRLAEIDALHAEIARAEALLGDKEQDQRWRAVESSAPRVERLNALRIECLSRLSPRGRAEILGLTQAGIDQLIREVDQLTLSFRLYIVTRARDLDVLPRVVRDVFAVGTASYAILKIALILAAAAFLRRRGPALLESARRALLQSSRGLRGTRRVESAFGAIQALAPWSLFLAALWCLEWALGPASRWPEVRLPYRILFLYGLYRLAIDALVGLIVRFARRYELHLDSTRTEKLIGSVRTMMRVVAGIAVLLALSTQFLGRGYLYHLVVDLAWVVVLAASLRILAGWREVITEAYLRIGPPGRLATLVHGTRDRWYGVFVAGASFTWLAGRAAVTLAREFALGFDQTRKALAFLFRRRMEKQAERQGYSEGRVESLPAILRSAFSEEAAADDTLVVEHFPGLARFQEHYDAWTSGRSGGSFLLAGDRGIGKSTWLHRARMDGVPETRASLARRVLRGADLASDLAPQLGQPASRGDGLDALRDFLASGPRRAIILDQCENLFLGSVGGYEAFESFTSLVESTCRRVFWLCSFTSFSLDHLSAVRPDLAVFRVRQILPPWSEQAIRGLIRARAAASKMTFTYEDLVVDRMEGVSAESTLLETEEGYTRLLWDYSDGNPRAALHFWLQSLVVESPHQARVRLFKAPSPDRLEEGGDAGLFLLAAIVQHQNLTQAEAAEATRFPLELCRIYLDRFLELGALVVNSERFAVATHWHRATVRLLKRKNLVSN